METSNLILEHYPDEILAKIEKRDRKKRLNTPNSVNGKNIQLVLEDLKLWRVGVLNVSFKGGSKELHEKIASAAGIWSEHGNINFDFGFDSSQGKYRNWTPGDNSHIRVGFEYDGYWSLLGNDSEDEEIVKPGDITLNLSGFDKQLPKDWESIVLHEFGHALGFHHEHQSPAHECDFNWNRLYDFLGGPPNYWPKWKVDHNLKQLRQGGLTYSAHDNKSIMHYSFPAWMFESKENSRCYTDTNYKLSEEDKRMAIKAYPFDANAIKLLDGKRIQNLNVLVKEVDTSDHKPLFSKQLNHYLKFQTDH